MLTALLVIAIMVILIVAHELGHFVAAKIFRVRVDEFGVGYPPRAFLMGKIGDTEYTLNWIPFGGFVRLFGEESEHGKGSFADAKRWKQAVILLAGVTMNAFVAYFLFAGALALGIPRAVDTPTPGVAAQLVVSAVVPGSPAAAAGIVSGDEITAVSDSGGARVEGGLSPQSVTAFIAAHPGKSVEVDYIHKKESLHASMKPAQGVLTNAAGRPALGVALVLVSNTSVPWRVALRESFSITKYQFESIATGLWGILKTTVQGAPNLKDVVGPVGLASYVGEAAQNGMGQVLELAGFISINLAIINLIPIPALDGGRLAVLLLETIMRKRAPRLAIQILNALGIALIILLMLTVTYHDISHLIGQ